MIQCAVLRRAGWTLPCLLARRPHSSRESTIDAFFFLQTLAVNDKTVKLEIWDTAGQERYQSLAPMYYRGAIATIVVYDSANV
ncbi:hypothetical protein ZWY2020_024795 [Hordeum vulgare]|nr:hypothetical protein ZWY2020_024795 [Hordeum vulgare]